MIRKIREFDILRTKIGTRVVSFSCDYEKKYIEIQNDISLFNNNVTYYKIILSVLILR